MPIPQSLVAPIKSSDELVYPGGLVAQILFPYFLFVMST